MPAAGTYWMKATGSPSGLWTTARRSPSSEGSNARPRVIEKPRSTSPRRLLVITDSRAERRTGSMRAGSWNEIV